jgi:hypothetical protein
MYCEESGGDDNVHNIMDARKRPIWGAVICKEGGKLISLSQEDMPCLLYGDWIQLLDFLGKKVRPLRRCIFPTPNVCIVCSMSIQVLNPMSRRPKIFHARKSYLINTKVDRFSLSFLHFFLPPKQKAWVSRVSLVFSGLANYKVVKRNALVSKKTQMKELAFWRPGGQLQRVEQWE